MMAMARLMKMLLLSSSGGRFVTAVTVAATGLGSKSAPTPTALIPRGRQLHQREEDALRPRRARSANYNSGGRQSMLPRKKNENKLRGTGAHQPRSASSSPTTPGAATRSPSAPPRVSSPSGEASSPSGEEASSSPGSSATSKTRSTSSRPNRGEVLALPESGSRGDLQQVEDHDERPALMTSSRLLNATENPLLGAKLPDNAEKVREKFAEFLDQELMKWWSIRHHQEFLLLKRKYLAFYKSYYAATRRNDPEQAERMFRPEHVESEFEIKIASEKEMVQWKSPVKPLDYISADDALHDIVLFADHEVAFDEGSSKEQVLTGWFGLQTFTGAAPAAVESNFFSNIYTKLLFEYATTRSKASHADEKLGVRVVNPTLHALLSEKKFLTTIELFMKKGNETWQVQVLRHSQEEHHMRDRYENDKRVPVTKVLPFKAAYDKAIGAEPLDKRSNYGSESSDFDTGLAKEVISQMVDGSLFEPNEEKLPEVELRKGAPNCIGELVVRVPAVRSAVDKLKTGEYVLRFNMKTLRLLSLQVKIADHSREVALQWNFRDPLGYTLGSWD
ncbi:unnamed protein product [Amoebophrya sp. A120]|nr:unnamed protein product [Amoebophrya sp. A120]|eukprot:GSA120T00023456001.1